MSETTAHTALDKATSEIESLKARLNELERKTGAALPNTNLLSDKFMTRAFAVFGHSFVASLVILVPFYALVFIIAMIAGANF